MMLGGLWSIPGHPNTHGNRREFLSTLRGTVQR